MSDESTPTPGQDSTIDDWFGQSVDRDAELADELTEGDADVDDPAVEEEFERRADGREEQAARHGESIDPDQGRRAYRDG